MSDNEQAVQEQAAPTDSPGAAQAPGDGGGSPEARAPTPVEERSVHTTKRPVDERPLDKQPIDVPAAEVEDNEATEIEEELDELVRTAAQRDEYLALAQRTQADFENYRKRVAKESAAAAERGVAKLAKELLPALDNLDRALEAADAQDPLLEGVRLVRLALSAALARVGVESYDPTGEQFDPAHHEAMAQRPVAGAESGTVVEVYQPGYRLNGTVIRPARVVVAA
jgi:molecular chaperone GrpE